MFQSVLTGKAQGTLSHLSSKVFGDYYNLKNAILKAYELVPETYRSMLIRAKKDIALMYV